MITVYYDGKCGLCSKEINYYKTLPTTTEFDWQDITISGEELEKEGISYSQGLKLLHAKDHDGKLHIGVDAFILIWKQFKYWRILGALIGLPIIKQLAQLAYKSFAHWRFKKLDHCQLALKQEKD